MYFNLSLVNVIFVCNGRWHSTRFIYNVMYICRDIVMRYIAYLYILINTHTCTNVHTCARTRTHIHIHTHIQSLFHSNSQTHIQITMSTHTTYPYMKERKRTSSCRGNYVKTCTYKHWRFDKS